MLRTHLSIIDMYHWSISHTHSRLFVLQLHTGREPLTLKPSLPSGHSSRLPTSPSVIRWQPMKTLRSCWSKAARPRCRSWNPLKRWPRASPSPRHGNPIRKSTLPAAPNFPMSLIRSTRRRKTFHDCRKRFERLWNYPSVNFLWFRNTVICWPRRMRLSMKLLLRPEPTNGVPTWRLSSTYPSMYCLFRFVHHHLLHSWCCLSCALITLLTYTRFLLVAQ